MDATRRRVWVDTDLALGAPSGDVDDGFALAALAAAQKRGSIELLGVSTVFGNTTAKRSEECARELLRRAGVEVRVIRGAEEEGEITSAAEEMARAAENNLYIVSLGPLSNLAAACRRDPTLPRRVHLGAVGGNLSSRGFLPPLWPFEFNFARDPASARSVLELPWSQLTLFPLDVSRSLTVGSGELEVLARTGPLGAYVAEQSARWLTRARWLHGRSRFPLWDLPAALDAIGLLGGTRAEELLARGARRFLRLDRAVTCVVSFDPREAWSRFLALLEALEAPL